MHGTSYDSTPWPENDKPKIRSLPVAVCTAAVQQANDLVSTHRGPAAPGSSRLLKRARGRPQCDREADVMSGACASGRSGKAGAAGRCARSRRTRYVAIMLAVLLLLGQLAKVAL